MIYRLGLKMTKLTHQMCLSKLYSTKKPIGQNRWAFAVLLSFVLWIGQHWVSKFSEKFFLTLSLGVEIYVSVLLASVFVGYISRSIGAEYGFLIHTMSERAMVLSLFSFYNRVFELD